MATRADFLTISPPCSAEQISHSWVFIFSHGSALQPRRPAWQQLALPYLIRAASAAAWRRDRRGGDLRFPMFRQPVEDVLGQPERLLTTRWGASGRQPMGRAAPIGQNRRRGLAQKARETVQSYNGRIVYLCYRHGISMPPGRRKKAGTCFRQKIASQEDDRAQSAQRAEAWCI